MKLAVMSHLDGEFYDKIDNPSERLAIITKDYTNNDPNWERVEKDVDNIKTTLWNLGFLKKNILEHDKCIAKNVIRKVTSDHCTAKKNNHDGYILMFNLTYKSKANQYRSKESWYESDFMQDIFVVNNLEEWATKPKLIFYQTAMETEKVQNIPLNKTQTDHHPNSVEVNLPNHIDIFESFSNDGDEDSYGDANGSFYIQALCKVINKRIADGSIINKCIDLIMCEVHEMIDKMVREAGFTAGQTPYYRSTFVKKFKFPLKRSNTLCEF